MCRWQLFLPVRFLTIAWSHHTHSARPNGCCFHTPIFSFFLSRTLWVLGAPPLCLHCNLLLTWFHSALPHRQQLPDPCIDINLYFTFSPRLPAPISSSPPLCNLRPLSPSSSFCLAGSWTAAGQALFSGALICEKGKGKSLRAAPLTELRPSAPVMALNSCECV